MPCCRSPTPCPPQQQDTICCKSLCLTLLMMGKRLPETCWADLIDQYIIVASSWFFCITLPNWWCTVKHKSSLHNIKFTLTGATSACQRPEKVQYVTDTTYERKKTLWRHRHRGKTILKYWTFFLINSWWWTDELSVTCRVSCQNKFVKSVHLVGFIIKKIVFFLLGDSPAAEFYVPTFWNTLSVQSS